MSYASADASQARWIVRHLQRCAPIPGVATEAPAHTVPLSYIEPSTGHYVAARQLMLLVHRCGVAHRNLTADTIYVYENPAERDTTYIVGWDNAVSNATQEQKDQDMERLETLYWGNRVRVHRPYASAGSGPRTTTWDRLRSSAIVETNNELFGH